MDSETPEEISEELELIRVDIPSSPNICNVCLFCTVIFAVFSPCSDRSVSIVSIFVSTTTGAKVTSMLPSSCMLSNSKSILLGSFES